MPSIPPRALLAALLIAFLFLPSALAADWPQFRGPGGLATAPAEAKPPTTWSGTENIRWKAALPGPGSSSPVTFGKFAYVTCYSGYGLDAENPGSKADLKRHLVCVRLADGGIEWTATIPKGREEGDYNSFVVRHGFASSTPVVDETGIYVFYGRVGMMAYDHNGKERWSKPCGDLYMNFGSAASPIIYKDLVIINADVESGAVIAFKKADGKEVWRYGGKPYEPNTWCTPLIVSVNGGDELVCYGKRKEIFGLNPADGKELWTVTTPIDSYQCPSFTTNSGIFYAIGEHPGIAVAVRLGGRGDVTDTHKLWTTRKGSVVCSPVYHDGHLYWCKEESSRFYCVEAATGKVVYEERAEPQVKLMYASPILANGNLYYVSQTTGTFVVEAKPQFKLVACNVIEGDDSIFNGTPAVSGHGLLLRSNRTLYFIGKSK